MFSNQFFNVPKNNLGFLSLNDTLTHGLFLLKKTGVFKVTTIIQAKIERPDEAQEINKTFVLLSYQVRIVKQHLLVSEHHSLDAGAKQYDRGNVWVTQLRKLASRGP